MPVILHNKVQDTYLYCTIFPQFPLCSLSHNLAHKWNLTFCGMVLSLTVYSPHSPHRAPGKVPHMIVLWVVLLSTMECTIGYYRCTIDRTIEYYGQYYGHTMAVLWSCYGWYYGHTMGSTMGSTMVILWVVLWAYYGQYYGHTMGILWALWRVPWLSYDVSMGHYHMSICNLSY